MIRTGVLAIWEPPGGVLFIIVVGIVMYGLVAIAGAALAVLLVGPRTRRAMVLPAIVSFLTLPVLGAAGAISDIVVALLAASAAAFATAVVQRSVSAGWLDAAGPVGVTGALALSGLGALLGAAVGQALGSLPSAIVLALIGGLTGILFAWTRRLRHSARRP